MWSFQWLSTRTSLKVIQVQELIVTTTNTVITLFWVYYLRDSSPLPWERVIIPILRRSRLTECVLWHVGGQQEWGLTPKQSFGSQVTWLGYAPWKDSVPVKQRTAGFCGGQNQGLDNWEWRHYISQRSCGSAQLASLFFFSLIFFCCFTLHMGGPWMANPYSCSLRPQYLLVHNHKCEFPINPAHWARPRSHWSLSRKIISCLWVGCSSQVHWWLPYAQTSPAPFPQAGDCG